MLKRKWILSGYSLILLFSIITVFLISKDHKEKRPSPQQIHQVQNVSSSARTIGLNCPLGTNPGLHFFTLVDHNKKTNQKTMVHVSDQLSMWIGASQSAPATNRVTNLIIVATHLPDGGKLVIGQIAHNISTMNNGDSQTFMLSTNAVNNYQKNYSYITYLLPVSSSKSSTMSYMATLYNKFGNVVATSNVAKIQWSNEG